MSAPTSLEFARTGTPDGTNGVKLANISAQEDTTVEIVGGLALSDRIPAAPTADRAGVSGNDTATTDMSTAGFAGAAGVNLHNVNNRGALVIWCEFANAAGSATVRVVYYDSSNNPLFVGPPLSFAAQTLRVSSAGDYMSIPQIVETFGASKYRPYVVALGTGNADVFGQPI